MIIEILIITFILVHQNNHILPPFLRHLRRIKDDIKQPCKPSWPTLSVYPQESRLTSSIYPYSSYAKPNNMLFFTS